MTTFFNSVINRYARDSQADQKMMNVGEAIGRMASEIEIDNAALKAIHAACSATPQAVAAYYATAQALSLNQDRIVIQMRNIHLLHIPLSSLLNSRSLPRVTMANTYRKPASCGLPGILEWSQNVIYELQGDYYGIRAEKTPAGAQWYFYNPQVKAL